MPLLLVCPSYDRPPLLLIVVSQPHPRPQQHVRVLHALHFEVVHLDVIHFVRQDREESVAEQLVLSRLLVDDGVGLHVGLEDCEGNVPVWFHFMSSYKKFIKIST